MANEGGLPCRLRCGLILKPSSFARWLGGRRTPRRPGAFWRWRRSRSFAHGGGPDRGVTLQIVRDWVVKFNARGPAGLIDRKPLGQPSILSEAHRQALIDMIEAGPVAAVHGVVRWRLVDLVQWLWEAFRITISKQTLSRELRALGYRSSPLVRAITPRARRQCSARRRGGPRPAPRDLVRRRGSGWPEEQDHPPLGQARHPSLSPRDRTQSASIFGAICPDQGKAAGLVLPRCTSEAMSLHLAEIAQAVARRPRGRAPRPGRLASGEAAGGAAQHHAPPTPRQSARVEPG